ncbi:MAG TPA: hypothetical protein VL128_00550 [Candidatus Eisenbacteria bacterium]|nr:hypothetical protein [Candidatus Eisenbacteria bacterium]
MKTRAPASTHKKVVIELADKAILRGYLNPSRLAGAEMLDLLTAEGEHEEVPLLKVRAVYFVRDLEEEFAPERKAFLSRPKLDGLWVKVKFRDEATLEGVIPNDLLAFLDNGLHLTPPDFNSNTDRIYVPRPAIAELTVLGVVGVARRKPPAAPPAQPRLFIE